MLLRTSSSSDYQEFLHSEKCKLSFSDQKRLHKQKLRSALWRLSKLDFDSVSSLLLSLYSQLFGRYAHDPIIYLRSFLLMQKLGYSSV